MQAEQPEHPCRRLAEAAVGPGKHGPDAARLVPGVERIESARGVTQLLHQCGERQARMHRGPGGGDRHCKRQPRAEQREFAGHAGLGGDPFRPKTSCQQLTGIWRAEQVQRNRVRALGGDQAGELVAAGH
jgi:hypothetical protein